MLKKDLFSALRSGHITFDDFIEQASEDFRALAGHAFKVGGFRSSSYDISDAVQDMFLSVFVNLHEYDEERGNEVRFFISRACFAVKRAMHYNRDKPSSELGEQPAAPSQEQVMLSLELCNMVPASDRQRMVMLSLARTGSLDVTTQELLEHPDTARMFPANRTRARVAVKRTADKLAARSVELTA